jgi:hypothetical protein
MKRRERQEKYGTAEFLLAILGVLAVQFMKHS